MVIIAVPVEQFITAVPVEQLAASKLGGEMDWSSEFLVGITRNVPKTVDILS